MDSERWPVKNRVAAAVVVVITLLVYLLLVPTVIARHYLTRFTAGLGDIDASFKTLASSTAMTVLNDPDVPIALGQQQLDDALRKIGDTRDALAKFEHSNQLATVPLSGLASSYRLATVRSEQVQTVSHQTRQLLTEYSDLLNYLKTYLSLRDSLVKELNSLNAIRDFDTLKGRGIIMADTASRIQQDQAALQAHTPPAGFTALHNAALDRFGQAAQNFERLGYALNRGLDTEIYQPVHALEQLALTVQVDDNDLLVSSTDHSPILLQIAELPEKLEYVEGR